jgi:hypothetical protein
MKIVQSQEELLKTTVRNALAANPRVSIRRMQGIVEENTGKSISDKYVSKLMEDMRIQALMESDMKTVTTRLSEVRERYRLLIEDLTRVIYWKQEYLLDYGIQAPNFREKIIAIKTVAQLETALFRTELLCVGFIERDRNATLRFEERIGISRTLTVEV